MSFGVVFVNSIQKINQVSERYSLEVDKVDETNTFVTLISIKKKTGFVGLHLFSYAWDPIDLNPDSDQPHMCA